MRKLLAVFLVAVTLLAGAVVLGPALLDASSHWRLPIHSGLTVGDLIYARARNELSGIQAVASGQVLTSAGTSTAPAWSASPTLTSAVFSTSIRVGGGTVLTNITRYQQSLSPAQVAANTTAEETFAVTGITSSDMIASINKPTAQAGLGIVGWRQCGTNCLGITFSNNTGSGITPTASQTYEVLTVRS